MRPVFIILFLLPTLLFSFFVAPGQDSYKSNETMSFNIITGYQSFPKTADINERLAANQFGNLNVSSFTLGIEIAVAGRRSILKTQLRGTAVFVPDKVKRPTLQPASVSIEYGIDIMQAAPATYIYPFGGIRYANWALSGRSVNDEKLSADKNNLDLTAGIGLKQFLNYDLRGVFNNVDISFGISLPLINGRWDGNNDTNTNLLQGVYKNQLSYFFLFTTGRGFRPGHR